MRQHTHTHTRRRGWSTSVPQAVCSHSHGAENVTGKEWRVWRKQTKQNRFTRDGREEDEGNDHAEEKEKEGHRNRSKRVCSVQCAACGTWILL